MKPTKKSGSASSKTKKSSSRTKAKKTSTSSEKVSVEEKNKYEERIVEVIDGIDDKIAQLRSESVKLKEAAKAKMDEQIIFLNKKKNELQETLTDLREHSGERWQEFKEGIEKGVVEMEAEAKELFAGVKSGFNYLFSKFKKK